MKSTNVFFVLLFSASLLYSSPPAFPLSSFDVITLRNVSRDADGTFYHNSLFDNNLPSIATPQSNYEINYIFSDRVMLKEKHDFEWVTQLHSTGDDVIADRRRRRLFLEFYSSLSESDIFAHEIEGIFADSYQSSSLSHLVSFQPLYQLNLSDASYLRTGLIVPSPDKPIAPDNYRQIIAGSRIEAGLDENIICGLNITQDLAKTMDIPNSGFDMSMLSRHDSWDYCFDFNIKNLSFWGFKHLDFKTEIANLWFNENTQGPTNQPKRHLAYKISLAGKIEELLFDCGYERIEPNFYTNNDYTYVDQELFRANLNYGFVDWLKLTAGYATYRDNLDDLLTTTAQSKTPQVSLFVNPLPWHKNLSLDFSYRCNLYDSPDESLKSTENIYKTTLSYHLENAYISLTGEHLTNVDKTEPVNDSDSGLTSFALGLRRLEVSPFLKLSTSVNSSIKRKKYGSSTQQDEFQKIMADFALEYKDFLSIKSGYFMEDNNKVEEFTDSTSHGWGFEITFKPKNDKLDTEFSLRYEQRKSDCEDNSKSYKDKVFKARFGLKL